MHTRYKITLDVTFHVSGYGEEPLPSSTQRALEHWFTARDGTRHKFETETVQRALSEILKACVGGALAHDTVITGDRERFEQLRNLWIEPSQIALVGTLSTADETAASEEPTP